MPADSCFTVPTIIVTMLARCSRTDRGKLKNCAAWCPDSSGVLQPVPLKAHVYLQGGVGGGIVLDKA